MSARESPRNLRVFGLLLAALLGALGGRLCGFRGPPFSPAAFTLLGLAVGSLLCALVAPRALLVIYRPWMRVARVLGRVSSTVLLTLVFFVVVTPLGLVMRLLGWDPLGRRRAAASPPAAAASRSFWHRREPALDEPRRLERLY